MLYVSTAKGASIEALASVGQPDISSMPVLNRLQQLQGCALLVVFIGHGAAVGETYKDVLVAAVGSRGTGCSCAL